MAQDHFCSCTYWFEGGFFVVQTELPVFVGLCSDLKKVINSTYAWGPGARVTRS